MSFTREAVKKVFGGIEGITDDMIQQIMTLHGVDLEKNKVNLDDYIPKNQFDELNGKLTAKQKEYDDLVKSYADKEKNTAINQAISNAKGKNAKAILALVDNDKITYKDGKLDGLEDQLKELQKSDAYLFDAPEKPVAITPKDLAPATGNFIAEMQKL
nr:MAG TPA: minor structural protein [Caudoviricetes sp.]